MGDIEVMRKETRSDLSIVLQNRAAISGKKKSEVILWAELLASIVGYRH